MSFQYVDHNVPDRAKASQQSLVGPYTIQSRLDAFQDSQEHLDTPSLTTGSSRSTSSSIIACDVCENPSQHCSCPDESSQYGFSKITYCGSRTASPASVIRLRQEPSALQNFIQKRFDFPSPPPRSAKGDDLTSNSTSHDDSGSPSHVEILPTASQTPGDVNPQVFHPDGNGMDTSRNDTDSEAEKSDEDDVDSDDDCSEYDEEISGDWSGEDDNIEAIVLEALRGDSTLAAHLIPILSRILYSDVRANVNQKVGPWRNGITYCSGSSAGDSSGRFPASGDASNQPTNPRKRRRTRNESNQEDRDAEDDDDEDDENGDSKDIGGISGVRAPAQNPYLACPFHKLNPIKYSVQHDAPDGAKKMHYRSCKGPGFKSIQRLKEHLKRKHRPVQCDRCYLIFSGPDWAAAALKLQNHRRLLTPCERGPDALMEGISDAQWGNLDKKSSPKKTQGTTRIEKYWQIWDTIFPGIARPSTPWYDGEDLAQSQGQYPRETRTFSELCATMLELKVKQQHILFAPGQEEEMMQRTVTLAEKAFAVFASLHWPVPASSSTRSMQQSSQFGSSYELVSNPRTFLGRHSSSGSRSTIARSQAYSTEVQGSPSSRRTSMPPPPLGMQQMNQQGFVANSMNVSIHPSQHHHNGGLHNGAYQPSFSDNSYSNNLASTNGMWYGDFSAAGDGYEPERAVNELNHVGFPGLDPSRISQEMINTATADAQELAGLPDWRHTLGNGANDSQMRYDGGSQ